MLTFIIILIVIVCIGLIGIVLIQNPKGGGISSSFGALNQISGVKQTTEGVEKVTWFLAIFLVVLSLLATPYMKGNVQRKDTPESSVPMELPANANAMPQLTPNGNASSAQPAPAEKPE